VIRVLTLQFVPYSEIENLDSKGRIDKLLGIVKSQKIVLMQGRLKPEEETLMIMETMAQIHKEFKGIEICTIYPEEKDLQFFNRMKKEMVKFLIGHRDGVTIIGPSTVVKEIRRNPNKVELLTVPGLAKRNFSVSRKKTRKRTTKRKTARKTTRRRR
jgi:hypothetical protein